MRFKPNQMLSLLSLLFVTQCDLWNDIFPPNPLANIDITGAVGLVIAPVGSAGKMARSNGDGPTGLFKITEDGYLLEVTYTNEAGGEYTAENYPVAVHNVDDNYVIVGFDASNTGEARTVWEGYLVRKSDGAVFRLCSVNPELFGREGSFPEAATVVYKNREVVSTDEAGNIYFISKSDIFGDAFVQVCKLDVTDPEAITSTTLTPTTETVDMFVVDSKGNVAYWGGETLTEARVNRLKKTNGGLYNLSVSSLAWRGMDGNIHYWVSDYSDPAAHSKIDYLSVSESGEVTVSEYWSQENALWSPSQDFKLELANRIIMVGGGGVACEVSNPSNTPREITGLGMSTIKIAVASDDYYYLVGSDESSNPVVMKVNPVDDSTTTLQSGEYDIYKLSVSTANEILFNALRMSDGKKVIGKIDAAGTTTIIDETLDQEVTVLERIM